MQELLEKGSAMELGAFSLSLAVGDMAASRDFYGRLGFEMIAGDGDSWTIIANGPTVIGLFHGMFEGHLLTFNPGWVGPAEPVEQYSDIRRLRATAVERGLQPSDDTTSESDTGPASFMLTDPDGNRILFDQHV